MRIGNTRIGQPGQAYIVAEIGVNHDGSESRARQLIDAAAAAGADAVKFQYFTAQRLLSRAARLAEYQATAGATDSFSMLQSLELPLEVMADLAQHARSLGLHPIVTVFSVEHVDEIQQILWAAFKVASPDIINRPLIEALAAIGKPMILSTGAATMDDIVHALVWIDPEQTALMQCISAYPTPPECANLAAIRTLRKQFDLPIGYSDHTREEWTGGLAVASGAVLLEKHLTFDRTATGPDHASSLDPSQFARYVKVARQAATMLGEPCKLVHEIERDVRSVSRQSVVTTQALKAGHVLRRQDLTIKRPGTGIDPRQLNQVIGRTLSTDVTADMPLMDSQLTGERLSNHSTKPQPIAHAA